MPPYKINPKFENLKDSDLPIPDVPFRFPELGGNRRDSSTVFSDEFLQELSTKFHIPKTKIEKLRTCLDFSITSYIQGRNTMRSRISHSEIKNQIVRISETAKKLSVLISDADPRVHHEFETKQSVLTLKEYNDILERNTFPMRHYEDLTEMGYIQDLENYGHIANWISEVLDYEISRIPIKKTRPGKAYSNFALECWANRIIDFWKELPDPKSTKNELRKFTYYGAGGRPKSEAGRFLLQLLNVFHPAEVDNLDSVLRRIKTGKGLHSH